jgi:hypothetical protein
VPECRHRRPRHRTQERNRVHPRTVNERRLRRALQFSKFSTSFFNMDFLSIKNSTKVGLFVLKQSNIRM